MFNLSPVGKYFIQVCTTTPCMIRGAKKINRYMSKNIFHKIKMSYLENKVCSWTRGRVFRCMCKCTNDAN